MIIGDMYSFNTGYEYIRQYNPTLLEEIEKIIDKIDASTCLLKEPYRTEKRKAKRAGVERFYSPTHINALFEYLFYRSGWRLKPRINTNKKDRVGGYREMDFIKAGVGVEVQMGKYAFLTYDIVAKMVIFRRLGAITCGVEICPMSDMLPYMSTGIGAFEQVKWDLEQRGSVADFDTPVLVIGIQPEAIPVTTQKSEQVEPEIILKRGKKPTDSIHRLVAETGFDLSSNK